MTLPEKEITSPGILYLIPTTLGTATVEAVLPPAVIQQIKLLDEFIVENSKSARQFLKACAIEIPQSQLIIHELDKHNSSVFEKVFFENLLKGKNVGLMSEAGCPAVADPGAHIVAEAHRRNIKVVPLTGPSSILLSLMASGLNGQQFAFLGYLPKEREERKTFIKKIEKESIQKRQTQIFIETPYRNNSMLNDLLNTCNNETRLCIAADITLETESVKTKRVFDWKKNIPDLHKKFVVFLFLA